MFWNSTPAYEAYRRFFWIKSIRQSPVVFFSNTNDYSSLIVFLLAALILGNTLWRCDTIQNMLLSVAVTGMAFFLLFAAGARLCLAGFVLLLLGVAAKAIIVRENRKRKLIGFLLSIICILGIVFCNRFHVLFNVEIKKDNYNQTQQTSQSNSRL